MASVIGAGTCQLRMVPADVGVHTLEAGFELGVNIVHVAEDYAGAMEIVHEAVKDSTHRIYVCSNGWGLLDQFAEQFERSLKMFGSIGTDGRLSLDMFGIACPEDREILGENVWGEGGLVDFLNKQKFLGRLRNSFCTTHGSPKYIRSLIEGDAFDAVMLSYNPLGYHNLSFNPPDDRGRESIEGNRPLIDFAASRDIGVMLMEVLGGGLLARSGAYALTKSPAAGDARPTLPSAAAVLRLILAEQPNASCLMPGVASVKEITENALAGQVDAKVSAVDVWRVLAAVGDLRTSVCSRCGACEPLCSQNLPISWLFRSSDISRLGAVPFETPRGMRYFDLHAPSALSTCATCRNVSCGCPSGIDIPASLTRAHGTMLDLLDRGGVAGPSNNGQAAPGNPLEGRLFESAWNGNFATVAVQNVGTDGWFRADQHAGVWLELRTCDSYVVPCGLRADVPPSGDAYFSFHISDPSSVTSGLLWLVFRGAAGEVLEEQELGPMTQSRRPWPEAETDGEGRVHVSFAASYPAHGIPAELVAGETYEAWVEIKNTGTERWNADPGDPSPVDMVLSVGESVRTLTLNGSVAPGETARIAFAFEAPPPGEAVLKLDMVRQSVAYFSDLGCEPFKLELRVGANGVAPSVTARYGIDFVEVKAPAAVAVRSRFGVWLRAVNTGAMTWEVHNANDRLVSVVVTMDGEIVTSFPLPHAVATSEGVDVHLVVPAPTAPGRHTLGLNLVHEGVTYFESCGVATWTTLIVVQAGEPAGARLYDLALRSNWAFYHPGGGVSRLADGTGLPQLLERAKGCHVWDTDGRRYLDYTMGWGSALLGHSNGIVEAAVRRAMENGPTLPLPHRLELELTEQLCQRAEIPCAEAVAFGKNGSDVCSLAVRLARLATGRKTIIICGYHGWQDWYAELLGFSGTGVPGRDPGLIVRVAYNDRKSLRAAIAANRHDLAGLIIEPSCAAGGPDMVGGDADPGFLALAADEVRAAGGLLIFDEIITGFPLSRRKRPEGRRRDARHGLFRQGARQWLCGLGSDWAQGRHEPDDAGLLRPDLQGRTLFAGRRVHRSIHLPDRARREPRVALRPAHAGRNC